MRLSRQRAAGRYGEPFASTVYVGDGVWDARACRNVGIPFIGIGSGSRATRLSAEGAVCVFPDFCETDLFLKSVYEITNAAQGLMTLRTATLEDCALLAELSHQQVLAHNEIGGGFWEASGFQSYSVYLERFTEGGSEA